MNERLERYWNYPEHTVDLPGGVSRCPLHGGNSGEAEDTLGATGGLQELG